MKYSLGIFFIISGNLLAEDKCALAMMKGHIRMNESGTFLVVAEKTQSEKKHPVKLEIQDRFAPYFNQFISGEFIITDRRIVGVKNINHDTYDPLLKGEETSYKKIKDEKCPKP